MGWEELEQTHACHPTQTRRRQHILTCISSEAWGRNSWRGGSSSRKVTGRPSISLDKSNKENQPTGQRSVGSDRGRLGFSFSSTGQGCSAPKRLGLGCSYTTEAVIGAKGRRRRGPGKALVQLLGRAGAGLSPPGLSSRPSTSANKRKAATAVCPPLPHAAVTVIRPSMLLDLFQRSVQEKKKQDEDTRALPSIPPGSPTSTHNFQAKERG